MSEVSDMPVLGRLLRSRYLLEAELGRGGMGVVYAAIDRQSGDQVAIKVIHQPRAGRSSERDRQRERLLMEARAAASVSHPNVVKMLDMGSDGDELFLVMERLEGMTLDAALRESGRIAPAQALRWLLPIMDALGALHRAGVVHRDLKPSNIFLSEGPLGITPKLLDFGLARSASDPRVTSSGQVIGTPAYMAPEHAAGEAAGPAADVWSLGVVLYECVAGATPFPPLDRPALAMQVLLGRVRPLLSTCPTLPVGFASAVDRALKRDLSQRYRSMSEMASGLAQAATEGGLDVPAVPTSQVSALEQARAALRSAPTEPNERLELRGVPHATPDRLRATRRSLIWAVCGVAVLATAVTASLLRTRSAHQHELLTPSGAARAPEAARHQAAPERAPEPRLQPHGAPQIVPVPAVLELTGPYAPSPQHPAAKPLPSSKRSRTRVHAERPLEPTRRRSRSGVETEWL